MKAIDKVLKWAQLLQCSCFGTKVGLSVDACLGYMGKMLIVSTSADEKLQHYLISADMTTAEIYAEWGKIKDEVGRLLEEHAGRRINKHGRAAEDGRDGDTNEAAMHGRDDNENV